MLNNVFDENQQINQLKSFEGKVDSDDLTHDMEAIKYFLWLNAERSGLFFANHIILVEGPTEQVLINYLISEEVIKLAQPGLFILDCMGKYNMHRFMNLLGNLNIPHSVLFDGDNNKGKHAELKKLLEESKNRYTVELEFFPKDIEDFLGIPPVRLKHRKPQHVMICFQNGKVTDECKQALIDLLNKMINDLADSSVSGDDLGSAIATPATVL